MHPDSHGMEPRTGIAPASVSKRRLFHLGLVLLSSSIMEANHPVMPVETRTFSH
jgi:hypothetical protein